MASAAANESAPARSARGKDPGRLLAPSDNPDAGLSRSAVLRGLVLCIVLFLGTRVVVGSAAYSGAALRVRIVQRIEPPIGWREKELRLQLADATSPLRRAMQRELGDFAPLLRWDAGHYRWIIEEGYKYEPARPGAPQSENQWNIAFFPLYPLLCRGLSPLVGVPGAMVLVANASALAAGVCTYLWALRRSSAAVAGATVGLLYAWPTACFLSFGYAESLAVLLMAACLLLADRGRLLGAALAAGLAGAARPTTVLLAPLLAWRAWQLRRGALPRRVAVVLGLAALALAGAAAYAWFLTVEFGSPRVYGDNLYAGWIQPSGRFRWDQFLLFARLWDQFRYFGRAIAGFPVGLIELSNPLAWNVPICLWLLFVSLAGLPRVPRDFRPWLLLAPLIFLQRYAAAGWTTFGIESMSRYLGLALPALLVLAAWMVRGWSVGARIAFVGGCLLLQATWAFHFGLGEWTG